MAQNNVLTSEERLEQGKIAVQERDMQQARLLLEPLVKQEPRNAEAWLWLSGAQNSPYEMAACLRQVLAIEPDNQDALDTMAWLEQKHGADALGATTTPAQPPRSPYATSPTFDDLDIDDTDTFQDSALDTPDGDDDIFETPRRSSGAHQRTLSQPKHSGSRLYPTSPYAKPFGRRQLLEYGIGVGGVGALIGLLRLAGQLRPGTLLLIRGTNGSITLGGAVIISIVTALLHGLALVGAWQILARSAAAARNDRQDDVPDSLGRLAQIFWPGYSLLLGLLLVALSLGAGEQRWLAVVALVWIILAVSVVIGGRRLMAICDGFRLDDERRGVVLARLIVPAIVVALLGLGVAGYITQRLLASV